MMLLILFSLSLACIVVLVKEIRLIVYSLCLLFLSFTTVLPALCILSCGGVMIFCIFFPDKYIVGDTVFTIVCMYCRFS